MSSEKISNEYDVRVHKLGRTTTLIAILVLVAVPLSASIIFRIKVDIVKTFIAFFSVFSLFGVVGTAEFFSFLPVLGAGGNYLSFITGNISNLKLPAALSSMKIANVEPGTKKAEIISVLAIGVSSIITTIILFLGMFLLSFLLPVLQSPTLKPAFDNLMPALIGALATPYIIKSYKLASVPCLVAALLTLVLGYALVVKYQSFLMPIFLLIAVAWSYVLYKAEKKKESKNNSSIGGTL